MTLHVHLLLHLSALDSVEVRAHLFVREALIVVVLFSVVLQRVKARLRFGEVRRLRRRASALHPRRVALPPLLRRPLQRKLATKKFQEMDGNFDDVLSRVEAKKYIAATAQSLEATEASLKGSKVSAAELETMPAAEKSQRQLAAAWAALKRGKRPARPSDDLPKQEL